MDNKDAITNKYSEFTPEAAAMISKEHEIRLQSQLEMFHQSVSRGRSRRKSTGVVSSKTAEGQRAGCRVNYESPTDRESKTSGDEIDP